MFYGIYLVSYTTFAIAAVVKTVIGESDVSLRPIYQTERTQNSIKKILNIKSVSRSVKLSQTAMLELRRLSADWHFDTIGINNI